MSSQNNPDFFQSKVLGHPSGLFVLFFTEMWERFSFYGMRVLLVLYLSASIIGTNPGLGWDIKSATALYGTYVMLLYITPVFGGILADKYLGSWKSVIIGAIIMTIGHASMAIESNVTFFIGLACLVIGTGFFKPNMPSILGEMYKDFPEKKDGGYTIFYMGVNAGAFFGMLLCGYFAERFGWHWGFGLAGIFMLLGTIQFWLSKPLFKTIGDLKKQTPEDEEKEVFNHPDEKIRNPFRFKDIVIIILVSIFGLLFAFNDPISKHMPEYDLFKFMDITYGEGNTIRGQYIIVILTLITFLYLIVTRINRYGKVVRDRMFSIIILACALIFFFMCFEQGASSLMIVARDYTNRVMEGNAAFAFNIANSLLTIVPLLFISWVLVRLAKQTFKVISASNITLLICFALIWAAAIVMLRTDWTTNAYKATYKAVEVPDIDKKTNLQRTDKDGNLLFKTEPIGLLDSTQTDYKVLDITSTVGSKQEFKVGQTVFIHPESGGKVALLTAEQKSKLAHDYSEHKENRNLITQATISQELKGQVEIPTTWFSTINALFIIMLASLISKIWDSKFNPPAAMKYGYGLIFVAIGFLVIGLGSMGMSTTAKLSLFWLVAIYFFHTVGELFISPVGLSYISKLVPARMMAFMYGIWYLAIAIAQKLAATLGGQVEEIQKEHSLSYFFFLFTGIALFAALFVILLNPLIKRLMHGVK